MYSPQVQAQIAEWRQLARENRLTPEQMREALKTLRGDRKAASVTSTASKTKKAAVKAVGDGSGLLDELDKM